jgi:hypothetical protein
MTQMHSVCGLLCNFFLVVLGFELRASHLLGRHCTTCLFLSWIFFFFFVVLGFELRAYIYFEALHQPFFFFFVMGFFKIGSFKLFAQAGFKP